jgi:hypothetical protein
MPEGPDAPLWLEVLAHISLVITTLFLVEIPLALWAFGLRYYNPFGEVPHAILHAFDAAIIMTTFVLEVILKGKERELASLLIILRLWRLIKLVGGENSHLHRVWAANSPIRQGIAVGAGELGEADAKELASIRRVLEKAEADLYAARNENEELRKRVTSLEQSSLTEEIPHRTVN